MFLQANESIHAAQVLAADFKFWVGVAAFMFGVLKAYQWVKEIRTKDVPDIKEQVKNLTGHIEALGSKLDTQTLQVVSELKEMRSDFRTFYCSPQPNPMFGGQQPYGMHLMAPVQAKATPKPRKPRERKTTIAEIVTETSE